VLVLNWLALISNRAGEFLSTSTSFELRHDKYGTYLARYDKAGNAKVLNRDGKAVVDGVVLVAGPTDGEKDELRVAVAAPKVAGVTKKPSVASAPRCGVNND